MTAVSVVYCYVNSIFGVLNFFNVQIVNECEKAEQWLREKTQQQDFLPRNVDPVLWSSDIRSKTDELNS